MGSLYDDMMERHARRMRGELTMVMIVTPSPLSGQQFYEHQGFKVYMRSLASGLKSLKCDLVLIDSRCSHVQKRLAYMCADTDGGITREFA